MSRITADIAVSLDGFAAGLTYDVGRVRPSEHVVHVTPRPSRT